MTISLTHYDTILCLPCLTLARDPSTERLRAAALPPDWLGARFAIRSVSSDFPLVCGDVVRARLSVNGCVEVTAIESFIDAPFFLLTPDPHAEDLGLSDLKLLLGLHEAGFQILHLTSGSLLVWGAPGTVLPHPDPWWEVETLTGRQRAHLVMQHLLPAGQSAHMDASCARMHAG